MLIKILSALLLVAGIGFLASVLLSLASHFFEVKKDDREQKLREMLPGANCGACGYKGCNDYAKCLARGGTSVNLCLPGGSELAKQLADFLGSNASEVEKKAALVRCNGSCGMVKTDYIYDGISSCKAAASYYGGQLACKFGCLGFGDCEKACPTGSICLVDGIARVNASCCHGCGKCASVCPKSIITILPLTARSAVLCSNTEKGAVARRNCSNACIGCKKCEKVCPVGAVKIQNNLARIYTSMCTGCGECVDACPTHCLTTIFDSVKR